MQIYEIEEERGSLYVGDGRRQSLSVPRSMEEERGSLCSGGGRRKS